MNQRENLYSKRANLWNSAKQFLDDNTDADGKVSAAVAKEVENKIAEIEALDKTLDRLTATASNGKRRFKRKDAKAMELANRDKQLSLFLERERLWRDAEDFYDSHVDKDSTMTAKDAATYKKMTEETERVNKELKAELEKPTTAPIRDAVGCGFGDDFTGGTQMAGKNFTGISGNEYRREFVNAIRDGFKFAVTNDILRTGALPQGGYLLPIELDERIFSALEENNCMRQICRVITTQSSHRIPVVASKPTATWTAEGDALIFSDESFSEVTLDAYKISCGLKISRELIEDAAFDVEAHIVDQCSNAIARSEEESFIIGDGNGKPTGLLTSLNGISDAVITTTGTDITTDDLINLEYELPRAYRKAAVWLCSDAAIAQIRRLKDSTGNFIWSPQLSENEPAKILGYKVFTSPFMPPPRSGAISVIFGDLQQAYTIGDRGGRTLQALHELFAVEDISAFILRERVDGKLVDDKAVKGLRLK